MTIKGFHGKKLTLTKERVRSDKVDRLTLKCGNKVLCNLYASEQFLHIFPKHMPGGTKDIFISFTGQAKSRI